MQFLQEYLVRLSESPEARRLEECVRAGRSTVLKGLHGSSYAMLLAALSQRHELSAVVLAEGYESACYLYSDLSNLIPEGQLYFFPY